MQVAGTLQEAWISFKIIQKNKDLRECSSFAFADPVARAETPAGNTISRIGKPALL
jgi:hypothetical protein